MLSYQTERKGIDNEHIKDANRRVKEISLHSKIEVQLGEMITTESTL